jgi:general secretion pathway protein G
MKRSGFTLVELVVVVLILGILAAIAVPKIISRTDEAADSGVSQSLSVIRDAIELYKAENAIYPTGTEADVKDQLDTYLQGTKFPKCKVGNLNGNVKVVSSGAFGVGGTEAWAYDTRDGEFIINSNDTLLTDASVMYSDL